MESSDSQVVGPMV